MSINFNNRFEKSIPQSKQSIPLSQQIRNVSREDGHGEIAKRKKASKKMAEKSSTRGYDQNVDDSMMQRFQNWNH